jgi:hypothetical protein
MASPQMRRVALTHSYLLLDFDCTQCTAVLLLLQCGMHLLLTLRSCCVVLPAHY